MQGGIPVADSRMFSLSPAFSVVSRPQKQRPQRTEFHLKEPGSAITHFVGLVLAIFATPPLLIHQAHKSTLQLLGFSVFLLSMIGLYAASTAYHAFHLA